MPDDMQDLHAVKASQAQSRTIVKDLPKTLLLLSDAGHAGNWGVTTPDT